MALKIRMSRGGRKKRPFYSIVVADSRMPRDGRYIEKIGTYNPLLAKDDENRVQIDADRAKHWLGEGAQPSDRVAMFLGKLGVAAMPEQKNNPEKAKPKAAAQQRLEDKAAKEEARKEAEAQEAEKAAEEVKAAEEAAKAEAEAPAEEAASEEAPAAETLEEEPKAEEASSEEASAEEAAATEEEKKEA